MKKTRKKFVVFILFSIVFGLYFIPVNAAGTENVLFHYTFEDYSGARDGENKPVVPSVLYNAEIPAAVWNREGMNQNTVLETATVNGRSGLRMKRTDDSSNRMYLLNTFADDTNTGIAHTYVAEAGILFENIDNGNLHTISSFMRTQSGSTVANFLIAEGGTFKTSSSYGAITTIATEEEREYRLGKWYDVILVAKEQKDEQGKLTGVLVSQYVNGKKLFEQHLKNYLRPTTDGIRFGGLNKKDQSLVFTDYKIYTAFNALALDSSGVTDGAEDVSCENINIRFNNKINTSTLASIVLRDESGNQIPIIAESETIAEKKYDLKSVVIKPTNGLLNYDSTYVLDLSGVEDLMGGTLKTEDAVLTFTTFKERLQYKLDLENNLITASVDTSSKSLMNQEEITLIVALYNQGTLKGVSYESRNLSINSNKDLLEVHFDILGFEAGEYDIKLFVWDRVDTMKPIGNNLFKTGVVNIPSVIPYVPPAGAEESTEYTIRVNSESIFTEHILNESYTRFAMEGQVNVEITVSEEIESFDISPHSEKIQGYVSGKKLTFSLSRPRKLIVSINQLEKLFIFAEAPEKDAPVLGDENVYNIMDYDISLEDGVCNGVKIQAAIDEISKKPNGGVLYFPNGKYETHNLEIGSNVHIYLESGAILKATADRSAYSPNRQHFIRFLHAENSKLTGRGTIDAGSRYLYSPGQFNMFGLMIYDSKNIMIDGVILRDPYQWNTTILQSEHITINNYKVLNDIQKLYTDGIDTVGSNGVLINDCFVYSGDDSFTVKNLPLTHSFFARNHRTDDEIVQRNSYDITIQNNVCWTLTSALKVGTETYADRVYNITVDNNDVVLTKRAMVLWVRDGTIVSDVQFINNRFESTGQGNLGSLIYFVLTERDDQSKPGVIKDIVLKDNKAETYGVFMSSIENMLVRGGVENTISNISIENLMIGGKYIRNSDELRLSTFGEVENITFKVEEKANEDGSINLRINGRYFDFDKSPIILNEVILVSMQEFLEAIGAVVDWDKDTNKITVTYGTQVITMTVGSTRATVNGQEVTLGVPPQVINGTTMMPIGFIAEVLEADVEWNDELKLVSVEGIETIADKQDDTYFEDNFDNYVGSASAYIPPENFWTLGGYVDSKAYTIGENVEGGTGNSLKLVMNGSDKRLSFYKEFLPVRYNKDTIVETKLMFKNTDAHIVGPELRTSHRVGATFQRALSFSDDGLIYIGNGPVGTYEAGVWYNIKVYVKISEVNGAPKTSFIVFINDEKVGEMDISDPTGYMDGIRYFVESNEDAALYLDYVKIYYAD